MNTVRATFRPEFLNRLDDILLFSSLHRESMDRIARIQLAPLFKAFQDRHMVLTLTDGAIEWLGQKGYDPLYGARPLKRVIQKDLIDPLSTLILQGAIAQGMQVSVDKIDDRLVITYQAVSTH
jgi:ATP-dependent Clp protease ATP-binding subunit ClpB